MDSQQCSVNTTKLREAHDALFQALVDLGRQIDDIHHSDRFYRFTEEVFKKILHEHVFRSVGMISIGDIQAIIRFDGPAKDYVPTGQTGKHSVLWLALELSAERLIHRTDTRTVRQALTAQLIGEQVQNQVAQLSVVSEEAEVAAVSVAATEELVEICDVTLPLGVTANKALDALEGYEALPQRVRTCFENYELLTVEQLLSYKSDFADWSFKRRLRRMNNFGRRSAREVAEWLIGLGFKGHMLQE